MTLVSVGDADSLWPGEMRGIVLDGVKVLLVNVEGTIHAYEDRCGHRAVELSLGRLERNEIICFAHEWRYDACTGRGLNPPDVQLRRFTVTVESGQIYVDTGDGS